MKLNNYEISNDEFSEKKFYRHRNRIVSDSTPVINLSIVNDKSKSKAYIVVEPNDFFDDKKSFIIFWKARGGSEIGLLDYRHEHEIGDYLFAAELLKFINLDFELTYCGIELFNEQSTEVFVQTFQDYHEIVSGILTINQ